MKERSRRAEHKSIFEDPETIKRAAKIAGIDITKKTTEQIERSVIRAGNKIIKRYATPPKNYRVIKDTPFSTPLIKSVVAIFWDDFLNGSARKISSRKTYTVRNSQEQQK